MPHHPSPEGGAYSEPVPAWVSAKWLDDADKPYRAIRKAIEKEAESHPKWTDPDGFYAKKSKQAFDAWHADYLNTEKLYRAMTYHLYVKGRSPAFVRAITDPYSSEFARERKLSYGFIFIVAPVNSYEFTRMGYRVVHDSEVFFKLGDVGERLMARDPMDRFTLLGMTNEFCMHAKLPAGFEARLRNHWKRIQASPQWTPYDEQNFVRMETNLGRNAEMIHRDYATARKKYQLAAEINARLIQTVEKYPEHRWRNEYYRAWGKNIQQLLAGLPKKQGEVRGGRPPFFPLLFRPEHLAGRFADDRLLQDVQRLS